MSDQELSAALAALERERNSAFAKQMAIIAEMASRGTTDHRGLGCDPGVWVRQVLRMDCHPARDLVRHAQALHPTHTPSGAEIPAAMPATAAAVDTGALSPSHVRAIHTTLTTLPAPTTDEDRATAETLLVETAEVIAPGQLLHLGKEILARVDHDGPEPREADPRPRRSLRIRHRRGYTEVHGELDPEAATLLDTVLQPLARRRSVEANGGVPDTRDPDERCADALVDALDMAVRSEELPGEAGEPVTLTVTIPLAELGQRVQSKMLSTAGLPIHHLRRMACDCAVIPAVLDTEGAVLDLGRKTRLISPGLRRALILRDRCCTFPGCHRRPPSCHAHHIHHWADGGPTHIDNLALVCIFHHRLLHHGDWTIHMAPDRRPQYLPPPYLDPQRKPRRNPHTTLT